MVFKQKIPNFLTLCNLTLGIVAIFFVLVDAWLLAVFCVFLASVCDYSDGYLARKWEVSSAFGKQLDSLGDLVTFGVAPCLLIFELYFTNANLVGLIGITSYIASGAVRLARFNLLETCPMFIGLPITACGVLLSFLAFILSQTSWPPTINQLILFGALLGGAWLMTSKITFKKWGLALYLSGDQS
ncbi:CDP-alcohol phosphatidyltransferase family protein [Amphibacillus jilinensis]|uniref:CDP-alcohol phosphatidyltransferase family protein n=1 Tax=Amphibacillus jilinensis TaxID=1216008 RepID=UPI0002FC81FE|nr:CDP-alcohol phosphatidyltransferase family protein [Amphibacillus jilinensis]